MLSQHLLVSKVPVQIKDRERVPDQGFRCRVELRFGAADGVEHRVWRRQVVGWEAEINGWPDGRRRPAEDRRAVGEKGLWMGRDRTLEGNERN
ncbi:hypothetical protein E3N88_12626 [Mikania micrantha]|uniref:Uncharacterized protein n=1 Tax=Mikania micrantha TaxID=192012 RepID=A0A5N6P8M4_9ASTR|nr:hypothetical protein E3N88_12610 [Mikania micrantha]KAD5961153.1 hypothetical protein E3N88_12626 [Mikania micrantha]